MDIRIKKSDIILIILAILVSGIALWFLSNRSAGAYVTIMSSEGTESFLLNENRSIEVQGRNQGKNVVCIENGVVLMKEANCPDKLCVKHKPIHLDGETIICLPNEVYVTVTSNNDRSIDN